MKLISKKITLAYFDAPGPIELAAWCKEHQYGGIDPTRDPNYVLKQETEGKDVQIHTDDPEGVNRALDNFGDDHPSDHLLAAALWHAKTKHPGADNLDVCSYAGLVAYLATGWYGGFGTDQYEKERRAENIVLALAGGSVTSTPGFCFAPSGVVEGSPSPEFTLRVLEFLKMFYFQDEVGAVRELQSKHALDLVRAGELLTSSQVAEMYGVTPRTVQRAVMQGDIRPEETAATKNGHLIARFAAERVWSKSKS